MVLCFFGKCLCGYSTFGVGSCATLKVAWHLVSCCHSVCHLLLITVRDHSFNVDFKVFDTACHSLFVLAVLFVSIRAAVRSIKSDGDVNLN